METQEIRIRTEAIITRLDALININSQLLEIFIQDFKETNEQVTNEPVMDPDDSEGDLDVDIPDYEEESNNKDKNLGKMTAEKRIDAL